VYAFGSFGFLVEDFHFLVHVLGGINAALCGFAQCRVISNKDARVAAVILAQLFGRQIAGNEQHSLIDDRPFRLAPVSSFLCGVDLKKLNEELKDLFVMLKKLFGELH
jgi:hypothetical protein